MIFAGPSLSKLRGKSQILWSSLPSCCLLLLAGSKGAELGHKSLPLLLPCCGSGYGVSATQLLVALTQGAKRAEVCRSLAYGFAYIQHRPFTLLHKEKRVYGQHNYTVFTEISHRDSLGLEYLYPRFLGWKFLGLVLIYAVHRVNCLYRFLLCRHTTDPCGSLHLGYYQMLMQHLNTSWQRLQSWRVVCHLLI